MLSKFVSWHYSFFSIIEFLRNMIHKFFKIFTFHIEFLHESKNEQKFNKKCFLCVLIMFFMCENFKFINAILKSVSLNNDFSILSNFAKMWAFSSNKDIQIKNFRFLFFMIFMNICNFLTKTRFLKNIFWQIRMFMNLISNHVRKIYVKIEKYAWEFIENMLINYIAMFENEFFNKVSNFWFNNILITNFHANRHFKKNINSIKYSFCVWNK